MNPDLGERILDWEPTRRVVDLLGFVICAFLLGLLTIAWVGLSDALGLL